MPDEMYKEEQSLAYEAGLNKLTISVLSESDKTVKSSIDSDANESQLL
jgi:hypothetical protein